MKKSLKRKSGLRRVLAIDPGLKGAFVLFDGKDFKWWPMPTVEIGKDKFVEFDGVHELLWELSDGNTDLECFLERAVSFGMGTKGAFNYGRGFAAVEIAIELLKMPVTYVEPGKWAKEMHQGISSDIKPKAKSLIAVKRLYPKLVDQLPRDKKGKLLDGPVDALLIAAYGLKRDKVQPEEPELGCAEFDFM